MKILKIIPVVLLFSVFLNVQVVLAEEYQCVVTSTRAEGCEAYYDIKKVCAFPDELNVQRTQEKQTGKFTYPEFCSNTCANTSNIPKKCQKGAITPLEFEYRDVETNTGTNDRDIPLSFNRPPQVGYEKERFVEIEYSDNIVIRTFQKIWNWFEERHAFNVYEIQPATTPVAGVRG